MKTIKDLLAQDGPILGLYMQSADPTVIEMAKWAGYDFIRIDNEHCMYDMSQLKELIRTAILCDMPCQVRVNDLNDITKILDAGATGIVVPDVNTVERAKEAIKAVKYYPIGERGMYPINYPVGRHIKAAGCSNFKEYVAKANDIVTLTIQIEDVKAKPYLDEIISLEGIDMVSSGKGDISQSLGIPGETMNPEVLDMEEAIIKSALRCGKQPVVLALSKEHMQAKMALGEKVFTCGMDESIFADALCAFVKKYKG